jgi:hypothetical protein
MINNLVQNLKKFRRKELVQGATLILVNAHIKSRDIDSARHKLYPVMQCCD